MMGNRPLIPMIKVFLKQPSVSSSENDWKLKRNEGKPVICYAWKKMKW